jgi:hypothetical protein
MACAICCGWRSWKKRSVVCRPPSVVCGLRISGVSGLSRVKAAGMNGSLQNESLHGKAELQNIGRRYALLPRPAVLIEDHQGW